MQRLKEPESQRASGRQIKMDRQWQRHKETQRDKTTADNTPHPISPPPPPPAGQQQHRALHELQLVLSDRRTVALMHRDKNTGTAVQNLTKFSTCTFQVLVSYYYRFYSCTSTSTCTFKYLKVLFKSTTFKYM